MLLVHHDDAERECAYGAQSKIGTFPNSIVASMQRDWKRIFAFEQ